MRMTFLWIVEGNLFMIEYLGLLFAARDSVRAVSVREGNLP
jgi:hypothetical protein